MSRHRYSGTELELFAHARCWKAYLASVVKRHLRGRVLEVGSGIGSTTLALRSDATSEWTALEPDLELARSARRAPALAGVSIVAGTLQAIAVRPVFDAVLYIDVLEHVENDRAELHAAALLLKRGGRLIVLAPAHPILFSPFDAALGHVRRYRRRELSALTPEGTRLIELRSLDSAGLLPVAANRWLLRSAGPSLVHVLVWDRLLVRCSRLLDPVTGYRVGKSILAVWEKV